MLSRLETLDREQLRGLEAYEREIAEQQLNARIAMMRATLDSVRVVHPPNEDDGVVRFGSTVVLRWRDGKIQTVRLVGPDEADVKAGFLSVESPLARILLGHTEGTFVEIERPAGVDEALVEKVTRDAAESTHRSAKT
jgi:transcription elongation factor GreB